MGGSFLTHAEAMHAPKDQLVMCDAASKGWLDVMRRQLAKGASKNAQDSDGWTPLYLAVRSTL
jgi:ankyrin repeat protein